MEIRMGSSYETHEFEHRGHMVARLVRQDQESPWQVCELYDEYRP